jgi:hypothetical protein
MPVFVTQLEGDTMMLLEAETSGAFAKSDLEIRPNPMAAFDNSVALIGTIGRIIGDRITNEYAGGGIEAAEVRFGVKVDGAGSVMLAQEGDKAQFVVKLTVRTG